MKLQENDSIKEAKKDNINISAKISNLFFFQILMI